MNNIEDEIEKQALNAAVINGYIDSDDIDKFKSGYKAALQKQQSNVSDETQSTEQSNESEDELWNEVGAIFNGSVSFKGYPHFLNKLKKSFSIKRK